MSMGSLMAVASGAALGSKGEGKWQPDIKLMLFTSAP